jgi:quercetin dioxygenase-like cupin family protein
MEKLVSFKSNATLENSRWYMGHLFTWLVTAEQTGGKFSILETTIRKGMEPPPHTHSRESETYYVTEGIMKFRAGNDQYTAGPGDCIYLPTGIQHEFKLETETAKCTILIEPGGFEGFFVDFSMPAEALTLPPPPAGPPSPELVKLFVDSLAKWGVDMPLMANV